MKKRLLLAYPNMRWLKEDITTTWNLNPATLCLLAAMVKEQVEVRVVDAQFNDLSHEQFRREVEAFRPHYVGLSLLSSEYRDTLDAAAAIVKGVSRDIVTIAGGVHVTTQFEYVMRNPDMDYCVRGEGEHVLGPLLRFIDGEGPLPAAGVVRRRDGEVVAQEKAIVEDLARLPWPDYSLLDFRPYFETAARKRSPNRAPAYPVVRMVTTRGCPFGCSFCQVETIASRRVRARDPEDVVDELQFLKERYGIRSVIFDEDNMLMAPDGYARRLFRLMIERRLELQWVATAFALFLLNDETLDLMQRSGCVGVNVAIESGNPRVLREIVGKPIRDLAEVPGIIAKIRARGLYCLANFIIGFPGETWDEIRQTIRFAETCGADYVKIYAAVPLYGTKLYRIAAETRALTQCDEFPRVDWRYGQITSPEWTPKDISILRAYEWDRINFAPERIARVAEIWGVSVEELRLVRKQTRDALVF